MNPGRVDRLAARQLSPSHFARGFAALLKCVEWGLIAVGFGRKPRALRPLSLKTGNSTKDPNGFQRPKDSDNKSGSRQWCRFCAGRRSTGHALALLARAEQRAERPAKLSKGRTSACYRRRAHRRRDCRPLAVVPGRSRSRSSSRARPTPPASTSRRASTAGSESARLSAATTSPPGNCCSRSTIRSW